MAAELCHAGGVIDHGRPSRVAPAAAPPAGEPSPRLSRARLERLALRAAVAPGRQPVDVTTPFDGSVLAAVPLGQPADVDAAIARARRVQDDWVHRDPAERAAILVRFHDLVLERQEEVLDLIQLESGKARKHAFEEVADTALVSRYYALRAAELLAPTRRHGALPGLTLAWEHHRPKGVVAIIAPWNYPLTLSISEAVPALLAGNAVVLKPDLQTPLTALWGQELLEEAGLPAGLLQIVTGEGRVLGPAMIAGADYLAFTGSTATGRRVAVQAAERLIGCSLELGGKNPMLVLADADLDGAVAGAVRGCFSSAGQLCISIERLYAHATIYHRFLERFVAQTQALRLGPGLDWNADMGSLASAEQLAKVEDHVRDAVGKGARVEAGGRARPDLGPHFFEPTILTGVTSAMKLYAAETFGPVVALYRVDSVNQAVERANDSVYGLNASVWTANTDLGQRVAARLTAGTVNVNEAYAATWGSIDAPMGGCKDSGLGRRHGSEGLLKYTEAQTIAVQRLLPLAAPPGVEDETFSRVMSQTLKLLRRVPGLR